MGKALLEFQSTKGDVLAAHKVHVIVCNHHFRYF